MISHSGYRVPDEAPPPYEAPLMVMSAGRYQFVSMPHYHTFRLHGRADYQLLYVAEGLARFTLEGRRVTVQAGEAVLYRPFEMQDYHYALADKPVVYWVHFTGTAVDALVTGLALQAHNTVGQDARLVRLFESIIHELQLKRPLADELTAALLQELLVRMARGASDDGGGMRLAMVEQAVDVIERRFAEPLTVAQLAAQFNLEVCWFSRVFRRRMGQSPQQYLIGVRMTKARELLRTSACPIGEVARLVGYENPLYFSRLFSKTCGCSPREYRRRVSEGESAVSHVGV